MKERIVTRNFVCTFIAQLALAFVMYSLASTITEYVADSGATATVAGFVSGMYVVGGLFSRLYSGNAMKKHGWKKIAMIFGIIHVIGSSLYFFVDGIFALIVVRFIHGVGFGATTNSIMIIAMAGLPKSRYGEAAGYFMLSASLGVAIGPFLGGLIYDTFGVTGCFAAAALFSLIVVLATLLVDTKEIDPWYKRNLSEPVVVREKKPFSIFNLIEVGALPIASCIFCLCFGYAALMSFYRLYGEYTGLTEAFRFFFVVYAAVLIFSRPMAGKVQDKFGDNAVCLPCIVAQALGIALIAWKPCLLTIVICAVCGALGYGTMNSTLNAIVNRKVSDDRRPFAVSTYFAFSDIGLGISPAILGVFVTNFDYHVMYYVAAAISFLALPIYIVAWGMKNGKKA